DFFVAFVCVCGTLLFRSARRALLASCRLARGRGTLAIRLFDGRKRPQDEPQGFEVFGLCVRGIRDGIRRICRKWWSRATDVSGRRRPDRCIAALPRDDQFESASL